jgi:hypothetical protein
MEKTIKSATVKNPLTARRVSSVSRYKKIFFWVIAGLGILAIFLAIIMALLPTLISLGPIREKILARISQDVGGQVACERLDLSFLPRPHVTVYHARISIPGKVSGNLSSLTIHPRIPPLLIGEVRLGGVKVDTLDFTMEVNEKGPHESKPFPLPVIQQKVVSAFAVLASKAPSLLVQVENAKLRVSEDRQPVFACQDIQASMDLPDHQVKVGVTGFILGIEGLRDLQRSLTGSPPGQTPRQADETGFIKGKALQAVFHTDRDKTQVSLTELKLDEPQVNVSGTLVFDQTSPQISLEVEGTDVDVDSTRVTALAVAGGIPVTRKIFDIVRGGKVPMVRLGTHGTSWQDLGKGENILIKGSMRHGKIFVPGAELDLDDVNGDAIISKDILEGSNLEARTGSISGHEGVLKLGLRGKNAPFHLDMLVEADLAQVPPLLKRLVSDTPFGHEMALMEHLQGHGRGRLVLGETTASIKPRVNLSEFNLSGRYQRIPYPVEIRGRDFSYGDKNVHATQLSGTVGKSSFSGASLGLDWRKRPYFEVTSAKVEIFFEQIYSWLASWDRARAYLKDFKRLDGNISLSELKVKGPLFEPDAWQWKTKGEIKRIAGGVSLLPGPIQVVGGNFDAAQDAAGQQFSFTGAYVTLLDAAVSVSGALGDFSEGLNKTDISLRGNMGPEATRWVSDAVGLPPQCRIRPPISISQGRLVWDRGTRTSFVGDLMVQDGPRLSLDVLRNPEGLMIKKLLVQDGNSHASLTLALKQQVLSLEYAGPLDKITMDKLLVKNQFCHGWVQGAISAQILLDRRVIAKAEGELKGEGLILPFHLKVPVNIDSFSLHAAKGRLTVESAVLTWGEDRVALGGSMKLSTSRVVLDMDLSADNLRWEELEEMFKSDHSPRKNRWELPVEGILRVKTEHFQYDQFTWSPVYAHVSFADHRIDVAVTEAHLCSISTPGMLKISPERLQLDFKPVSKDQDLARTLACLGDKKGLVTGRFDLEGEIMRQETGEGGIKSLYGDLELLANNGRIHRHGLLAKIFAFLNVAGIFKGQIPDITKEGFPYDSIKVKGSLRNGKVVLTEGHLDSPSMEIACQGDIDLLDKELNLQYLVAPLKTVDLFVKKIPLLSDVLQGTLVSIPVKVTGPWADPEINALSPSAVGSGLLGIMKRTVELPLKIIEPRAPEKKPD